ncbi:MAG: SGNH/GDSL hydrolase family protein [Planctomycetota bacterium]
MFSALTGLLGFGIWTLDWVWLGGRYPADPLARLALPRYENRLFVPEVPARAWKERISEKRELRREDVVVLGGSQTWGSGAQLSGDVWTRRVERELNERWEQRAIRVLNFARSRAITSEMVDRLDEHLGEHAPPSAVVGVFSHNDLDAVAFGQSVIELWKRTARVGIPLILVAEANCPSGRARNLEANHEVLRKLTAGVPNVTLLEVQDDLDRVADSGFLWWDLVHLTTAGQTVLADLMADRLEECLR